MTWNTESILSVAIKRRKRVEQSGRKHFKSRRPSVRHYTGNSQRSKCYSPSKGKLKPASVEISLEIVGKDTGEEEKGRDSPALKTSIVRYCERFANGITKKKIFRLQNGGSGRGRQQSLEKLGESIECVRAIDRGCVNGNSQPTTDAGGAVTDSSVSDRPEQSSGHSTASHKPSVPPCVSSSSASPCTVSQNALIRTESVQSMSSVFTSPCTQVQTESENLSMVNVSTGLDKSCADVSSPSCSAKIVESVIRPEGPRNVRACEEEIAKIPNTDISTDPRQTSQQGRVSDSKRSQRSPEKSHRSLYSCRTVGHPSRSLSSHAPCQTIGEASSYQRSLYSRAPCRTVGEPSSYQSKCESSSHQSRPSVDSSNGSYTDNKVMRTVKLKGTRRRKTSLSKAKHKHTLKAKETQSELGTQQDSTRTREGCEDNPSLLTKRNAGSVEVSEISLEDIDVDIKSDQDLQHPLDSTPGSDGDSTVLSALEDCIHEQDEALQQEGSSLPSKPTRYISTSRRPKHRKVKGRVHRRPRKILVIGDMTTGKTNLVSAYSRDRFTENYTPTILNCCKTDARLCGEVIDLVVVEVSGRDDYHPLRRRAYRKMDAAIVCYSVDSQQSLQRVCDYWVPELNRHAPSVPFILVGTKKDIRDEARYKLEEELADKENRRRSDEGRWGRSQSLMAARLRGEASFRERYVSREKGGSLAERVGAEAFLECSSLYRDHTREVFETTTKIALRKSRRLRTDNRSLEAACIIL